VRMKERSGKNTPARRRTGSLYQASIFSDFHPEKRWKKKDQKNEKREKTAKTRGSLDQVFEGREGSSAREMADATSPEKQQKEVT